MAVTKPTDADFNAVAQDKLFTEQGAVVVNNAENKRIALGNALNAFDNGENAENKRISAERVVDPED